MIASAALWPIPDPVPHIMPCPIMLAIPPSKEDPPSDDDRVDGGGAPVVVVGERRTRRVNIVQKSGDEEEAFSSQFSISLETNKRVDYYWFT